MKLGLGTVVLAALIVFGIFLAASFVLMLLVNIVLNQYNAEPLQYGSAMAVVLLLGIFGGAIRGSKSYN